MERREVCCVLCERGDREVPLVRFRFKDRELHICTQHLPILIHEPTRLEGKLPGSEHLSPAEEPR